jgi:hypothetical protein
MPARLAHSSAMSSKTFAALEKAIPSSGPRHEFNVYRCARLFTRRLLPHSSAKVAAGKEVIEDFARR